MYNQPNKKRLKGEVLKTSYADKEQSNGLWRIYKIITNIETGVVRRKCIHKNLTYEACEELLYKLERSL